MRINMHYIEKCLPCLFKKNMAGDFMLTFVI